MTARLRPDHHGIGPPRCALLGRARAQLPAVAVLAAAVGSWESWVRIRDTPDYVLPPPSQIWHAFVADRATLWGHAVTTAGEAVVGLVAGVGVGSPACSRWQPPASTVQPTCRATATAVSAGSSNERSSTG